jgi:putative tricarboxylic transport membrane protein
MNTDRILGATAIAVAAIMVVYGHGLAAPFAYEPVGPRAFPLIAAAIIAVCGVILVLKPSPAESPEHPMPGRAITALSGSLLAYALLFQPVGFVIATTVLMVPIAMIFGAKWWQGAVTGLVLAVSSFLLFDRVLDVVLPVGPLGGII